MYGGNLMSDHSLGCCSTCQGTGHTDDSSTGGMCWDCRGTGHPHDPCTCPWTPEETWLSAASCGYGGGYEPGSQCEDDPGCPEHGDGSSVCPECCAPRVIEEEFDDQIGFEEQARPVHVARLNCGHEIVTPGRWDFR